MNIDSIDELNLFMREFQKHTIQENILRNKIKNEKVRNFSIFNILNLSSKEKYHTKFLAYLLNPYSGHGQGSLFLDEFMKCVKEERKDFLGTVSSEDDIKVHAEYYYRYFEDGRYNSGYIDIILIKNDKPYFAIENKIYASELYNDREEKWQCERYFDFISKFSVFPNKNIPVLYLTLRGDSSFSNKKAIPISYCETISRFLLRVLPLIRCKVVESVVQQYRLAILDLMNLRGNDMSVLDGLALNFLTQGDNYENARKISEMVSKFGDSMTLAFFNTLKRELENLKEDRMVVQMWPMQISGNKEKGVYLSYGFGSRFYSVFGFPADKSIVDRNDDPGVPWLGVFVTTPGDAALYDAIKVAVAPWFSNKGIKPLEGGYRYPAYSAAPEWPVMEPKDFSSLLGVEGERYAGILAVSMIELLNIVSKAIEQSRL